MTTRPCFALLLAFALTACGTTVQPAPQPDAGAPACLVDADCDDGDPCSEDLCGDGACAWRTREDGEPCDDGMVCLPDAGALACLPAP